MTDVFRGKSIVSDRLREKLSLFAQQIVVTEIPTIKAEVNGASEHLSVVLDKCSMDFIHENIAIHDKFAIADDSIAIESKSSPTEKISTETAAEKAKEEMAKLEEDLEVTGEVQSVDVETVAEGLALAKKVLGEIEEEFVSDGEEEAVKEEPAENSAPDTE